MGTRLELQGLLEDTLGSRNVYFQPPPSVRMRYPAILYERTGIRAKHANNRQYNSTTEYLITVMDADPENACIEKLIKFPMCSFERHYNSNNLNHDVFRLFY